MKEPLSRSSRIIMASKQSTCGQLYLEAESFFSTPPLRQFFNRDVFVPGLRLAAAVDLQTDDAEQRNCIVRLGVIECLIAVERGAQPLALAPDDVFVPV